MVSDTILAYNELTVGKRLHRQRTSLSLLACVVACLGLACADDENDNGGNGEDVNADQAQTVTAQLTPEEQANVVVATRVLREGLIGGDTAVINELVRADYIQHNLQAMDGRAGLLAFVAFLQTQGPGAIEIHRVLANGNYVALHSTYGTGANRQVAFDVFRLDNGQLAEHWDALTPWVEASDSVSGNTLVDGATEVSDRDKTQQNRELVLSFVEAVFQRGQLERLPEFIGDTYIQHNPQAPSGLAGLQGFFANLQTQGLAVGFTDSPLVVADGNFVLVGSEGFFGAPDVKPYAVFYDLFRVDAGKLVEHWDVIPTLPANLADIPHDNGVFGNPAP
jgi:predicted SnoaL-like aldol condensation-catalyzing enzyme